MLRVRISSPAPKPFTMLATLIAASALHAPSHRWLFAVSCLDFKSPTLALIPDQGRTDGDVIKAFGDTRRTVWLQGKRADSKRVDYEFREALRRVRPDDDLIVFYTGHGYVRGGKMFLATWNADIGNDGWSMQRAFEQVKRLFKGRSLAFFADCCSAGPMATLAESTNKSIALVASSTGLEPVPIDWTFASALAAVMRGDRTIDTDQNGRIEQREVVGEFSRVTGRAGTVYTSPGFSLIWPVHH